MPMVYMYSSTSAHTGRLLGDSWVALVPPIECFCELRYVFVGSHYFGGFIPVARVFIWSIAMRAEV